MNEEVSLYAVFERIYSTSWSSWLINLSSRAYLFLRASSKRVGPKHNETWNKASCWTVWCPVQWFSTRWVWDVHAGTYNLLYLFNQACRALAWYSLASHLAMKPNSLNRLCLTRSSAEVCQLCLWCFCWIHGHKTRHAKVSKGAAGQQCRSVCRC